MALYRGFCTTVRNILYSFFFLVAWFPTHQTWAEEGPQNGDFIMRHVQDAHEWHVVTIGQTHVTLPLPVIIYSPGNGFAIFSSSHLKDGHHQHVPYRGYMLNENEKIVALDEGRVFYDLSLTKNIIAMWISVLILLALFLIAAQHYKRRLQTAPRGFWALLELLICFVRDAIALPNIGKKNYKRFMPYLLSMFFFIWLNNLLGLLPGAANVTGNISITLALALFTFVMTNLNGNQHYWDHVFNTPGVPRWLSPIMVPVELLGLFTKPFALMIRFICQYHRRSYHFAQYYWPDIYFKEYMGRFSERAFWCFYVFTQAPCRFPTSLYLYAAFGHLFGYGRRKLRIRNKRSSEPF
jgi:F-type H+-transporting ATPase subunit a